MFWQPGLASFRRRVANAANPLKGVVIEDRICTNSIMARDGRLRCLKWEPKPANYKPAKVADKKPIEAEPQATTEELALLRPLSPFVRSRAAVAELQSSGRLYRLTRRVGGELLGYLKQPERPAICTGTQAMLDFYERRLSPLSQLGDDLDDGVQRIQQLLQERVAAATAAWSAKPVSSAATDTPPEKPTHREAVPPVVQGILPKVRGNLRDQVLTTAEVMLSKDHVGQIAAESDLFAMLVRARETMSAGATHEAPPHVRKAVFHAFRAIEITYYANLRKRRYRAYRDALFGLIDTIRSRHEKSCQC
ncbi:MAG: hypothetical protein ACR2PA_03125 [Hyphomicrobiaceae bacterium]